ncbi:MAG: Omp28-related outer membrane protein [Saprospiraceae bacterium]|nr:Omp28-related outer membrane protein [Bacteroidia bacterium]NNL93910.1 Omp28-related outer membrane protein [Saprospiraceae bacterium]
MKKLYSLFLFCFAASLINAQITFYDDFESYSPGNYLGDVSPDWTTWSGATGGSLDVKITDDMASSGKNSIFFSSTAPSGGPVDIVLPFGDKYESGLFTFSLKIYIPENGSAYWNFQGEEAIGQVWCHNAYFLPSGEIQFSNSDNGLALGSTYEKDSWITVDYEINLTENSWKINVNNECIGSFTNGFNAVASANIYPTTGNAFYIDDVTFSHNTNVEEKRLDGALAMSSVPAAGFTGMEQGITGTITNTGSEMVTSAEVVVKFPDGDKNFTFDNLTLAKGDAYEFEIPEMYVIAEGNADIKVELLKLNNETDEEFCNNIFSGQVLGVTPKEGKNIIVEEGTGTWCGFCPRGAVFLEALTKKYGKRFIGIAVHNGDPMVVSNYDGQHGFTGYPGATVMRRSVDTGFGIIEDLELPFLNYISENPLASFSVGASFDESTRRLDFSSEVVAKRLIDGDNRIAIVITEDGVTGTSSGYAQSNYYAGGDRGPMGGYENLPATVPASGMVYDHVARAVPLGYAGDTSSFETELKKDEMRLFNYQYQIPASFNLDNMHIVMMLINSDGTINNGYSISIPDALEGGFTSGNEDLIEEVEEINVFPNPTSDNLNVTIHSNTNLKVNIDVINVLSQKMTSMVKTLINGENTLNIMTNDYPSGQYYIVIRDNDARRVVQFIKE